MTDGLNKIYHLVPK